MDDTISRRAAIDIVDGWFKRIELNADICLDGLRQLPSATDKNVGAKLGTNLAELGTDCISRQAAITQLSHNKNKGDDEWELAVENDIKTIWQLPPVQPRPSGKWIPSVDRWGDIITTVDGYTCSECGSFNTDKDNFCPNCGSRNEVTE